MKKQFLLSLLILTGVLFLQAQTQRMVLYEGFSNAGCGPCAQANPNINQILKNNSDKVVGIKYQVDWPGFDPMNAQNPEEPNIRRNYYGITGVPSTRLNGVNTSLSQTYINTQYAVPAPFQLDIHHEFNEDVDSVFVRCIITAAQNFTGSQLKLHVAMIEKEIHFATAPGSNGEKSFFHIMRKMYPDAQGTTLPNAWQNGESDTIFFSGKIPKYIYDLTQIHFIAFIQTNANKAVHQAAKNNPIALQDYLKITKHNIPKEPGCYEDLSIDLTIKNQGTNTVESFQVEYGIIGQEPMIFNWTGTLAVNQTVDIQLPAVIVPQGTSIVFVQIQSPNNSMTYPKLHARIESQLALVSEFSQVPLVEEFTSSSFPPSRWNVVSYDEAVTWERASVGGFGQTPGGSAMMSFYQSPSGQIDLMYMKPLDFSSMSEIQMSFSVAYARYNSSFSDALRIQISTNCGASWSIIYNKNGSILATAPDATNFFTPTASQWRKEVINLNNYAGKSNVLIRFNALSGYGNNLYIDNINIDVPSSINANDPAISSLNVFPNPIGTMFTIDLNTNDVTDIQIHIYDHLGRLIEQDSFGQTQLGLNQKSINASHWASGMYNLVLTTPTGTTTKKLIK
jgi:hypothetical protein